MNMRTQVYVLRSANGLKIGYTKDLTQRLQNLRTADPDLTLIMSFPGDQQTEKAIHRRLQSDRLNGEFFRDNPQVLAVLRTLKTYYEQSFSC